MTTPRVRVVVSCCLLGLACGPAIDDPQDSGGAETDAVGSSGASSAGGSTSASGGGGGGSTPGNPTTATAGTSSDPTTTTTTSGGVGECPPNAVWAEPGCFDPEPFGQVPLPGAGCYEVCDATADTCSAGACVEAVVNPCPCDDGGQCCDACGAPQTLCVVGEPVAPGFEATLVHQQGCGWGSVFLYAFDEANDLALTVSLPEADFTTMPTELDQTYGLPSAAAEVTLVSGPQVAGLYCTDAGFGTVLREYVGIEGAVHLVGTSVEQDPSSSTNAVVTVSLSDVVLEDSDDGSMLLLEQYVFSDVEVWCCPG